VSLKVSLPVPEPESHQAPQTESDCPICFDAFPTAEGRGLLQCGHLYCHQCLASHFETKIAENQVATEDLKCPDPSCTSTAASYELEALVSTASYARYCELITLASLRGTPGSAEGTMAWCPKSQCSEAILLGAEDTGDIECPTCKTHFCASCKATPYHTGKTCAEAKATPAAASSGKDAQFDNYMKHVGTRVKPCPQCGTAIEKNGGCMSFSSSSSSSFLLIHLR
ncbi:MAG: E3 ubiquitin protein ligase, partial [Microbacteriaceae bacterium]|nr:E3 ubiquitin protein ligase [Microbacteriaceae bacterium]